MRALAGNTNDCKTLRMFLDKIEKQYGCARRVWVMDRLASIPTEPGIGRNAGPAIRRCSIWWERRKGASLVCWKKQLLDKPWQQAREGVAVKLLANDGELYVFAQK